MSHKRSYVDYQQRATEFKKGDVVYPNFGRQEVPGRVVAVYPAIGMVDIEWPHGSSRMPVEDLQIYIQQEYNPPAVEHDNVPGGKGTVSVPGGPKDSAKVRLARAFLEQRGCYSDDGQGID